MNYAMAMRDSTRSVVARKCSASSAQARAIAAGELLPVLSDFAPAGGQVSAVFRQSKRGSPKIQSLVKFVAERLGQPPVWELAIRDKVDAQARSFARTPARFDDAALSLTSCSV